jgi:hypothetical protein
MKRFYIDFIQLSVTNCFVLVGFFPFIFLLQNFPSIISGFYFYETKVTKFSDAPEPMGKSYNTCYVIVEFNDKYGNRAISSEFCENFDYENDIGKRIYVRISNESSIKWIVPPMKDGNRIFNSVISIEGRQINSKYNMPWFFLSLSLFGLIMFVCWLKYSLIPRLKGTHPLQIALKNQSQKFKE